MWVYKPVAAGWAVGYYDPWDNWIEDMVCATKNEASGRVHYLNGGN